ncbi:NfeD family protein [Alkalibaculum sp. M08DMB]|uniref:NfeD family protein n=1 Tax=Alkalibaculum sporogenes TaxID=2655001 RepID=A0A6A7K567_9FIRM|nr:NfeD family protein [Alkalibaculum sporogenes]MPW24609.1 NfeD family protein [Alkalibaculum sporogenes]
MYAEIFIEGWIIAVIIFTIVEILTLGLATIWFAIGSLVALLAALLHFPFPVQFALFLITSLLLLAFTRPIVKDYLKVGKSKTNLDSIIGSIGIVTEDIEPFKYGQVKVNGQIWTGVSENKNSIIKDTRVEITNIEGVKLIVKNIEEE